MGLRLNLESIRLLKHYAKRTGWQLRANGGVFLSRPRDHAWQPVCDSAECLADARLVWLAAGGKA